MNTQKLRIYIIILMLIVWVILLVNYITRDTEITYTNPYEVNISERIVDFSFVEIVTAQGSVRIKLLGDEYPISTNCFIRMVETGFFIDYKITRTIQDNLIQFGKFVNQVGYWHACPYEDVKRNHKNPLFLTKASDGKGVGPEFAIVINESWPITRNIVGEVVVGRSILENLTVNDSIEVRLVY